MSAPGSTGVGPLGREVDADSRARTHLANERTFLAWLRTGLSLIAVGMGAAGFLPFDLIPGFPYVTIFSVAFVVSGACLVILGASRFASAANSIEIGNYNPDATPMFVVAFVAALLGIMAIPLVFLLR